MHNKDTLLLFDIDGTLLVPPTNNILHKRFTELFNTTFGTNIEVDRVDTIGKTVKRIFIELGKSEGIKRRAVLKKLKQIFKYEIEYIKKHWRNHNYFVINGVFPLLKELK